MENPPFEDVFPIQDGDFPLLCLFTRGYLFLFLGLRLTEFQHASHVELVISPHLTAVQRCHGRNRRGILEDHTITHRIHVCLPSFS